MFMCIGPERILFTLVVPAKCSTRTKHKMRRKEKKVRVRQNLHEDSEVKDVGWKNCPVVGEQMFLVVMNAILCLNLEVSLMCHSSKQPDFLSARQKSCWLKFRSGRTKSG